MRGLRVGHISAIVRTVIVSVAVIMAGCKSRPLGPYVSPRVTGQVFAADTQQPLAGVSVMRGAGPHRSGPPANGAELLMRKAPAKTDANGTFELASERVLSIVRGAGWNVVSLSFQRAGYERLGTNCSIDLMTNAPNGEPVLDLGRVILQPASK